MYQTGDHAATTMTSNGHTGSWNLDNGSLMKQLQEGPLPMDSDSGHMGLSNGHIYSFGNEQELDSTQFQQPDMKFANPVGYGLQGSFHGEFQHPSSLTKDSPSPPPPPRRYKPCVVCNDKSSGFHYGVSSCEGCKGFFRRSVQKNMQYTCHKEKSCEINKVTRNRCQFCRLQKCFTMGMSKEAVRNDRNKKRKNKQESSVSSQQSECLTEEEQDLINKLVEAHSETFPDMVDDKQFTMSQVDLDNNGEVILWEKVWELSTKGIEKIVEFSKRVPGFLTLSQSDQVILLKSACLEIMVLRLASRYNEEEEMVILSNSLKLSRDHLESGGFGALTDTIMKFAKCLHSMEVDSTEYALLSAICLISGDRSGLEHPLEVEKVQERILEALKHYMRQRRTGTTVHPHSFAKVLLKLTDLRSISVKGAERVLHLRMEMPTELPPLILEMLDRAENVCIP